MTPISNTGKVAHSKRPAAHAGSRHSKDAPETRAEKRAEEQHQALVLATRPTTGPGQPEIFRSPAPEREPFIKVVVGDHKEIYPLKKGEDFEEWTRLQFYRQTGGALPKKIFIAFLEQLQAQAKFDGPECQVPLRVAEHQGNIYLDLCNDKWQVVEITPAGWQVIDNPPVCFRRSPGMLPLPIPESGGSVEQLFEFINVKNPADRMLVLAWLFATFRPTGPYPILALHGSQGSAKTTTETILRRMIDPMKANLSGVPRDERDLLISVRHSHLLGFDNLSKISDSLSEALSRVATGSGLATRKLYTDDRQMIFSGARPILLNGINDIATRGDLLDRMIVLQLPKISESERREVQTILREFEKAQPKILGAVLDAVSVALREVGNIHFSNLPRMADFAVWTAAGAKALGFTADEVIAAYDHNRLEANFIALENAPAAVEIFRWMTTEQIEPWQGTCQHLLHKLNARISTSTTWDHNWPKNARAMQAVLARSEPNLAAAGVTVTKLQREAGTGQRLYRITVTPSQSGTITGIESLPKRDGVTIQREKSKDTIACPHPGCSEEFPNRSVLKKHGRASHGISDAEIAKFMALAKIKVVSRHA
jgi:hypothetical protein